MVPGWEKPRGQDARRPSQGYYLWEVATFRRPGRPAAGLVLIPIICLWSVVASADPPGGPGSEVIDPWAPAIQYVPWHGPHSEVVNPWHGGGAARGARRESLIVDPWHTQPHNIPTAAFPPIDVVDPWSH